MSLKQIVTAGLVAFGLASTAGAAPVDWVLKDVVFGDGGTATGSFTFDADTNTYSNIDILRSAGSTPGPLNGIIQEAQDFNIVSPGGSGFATSSTVIFTSDDADLTGLLFFQMTFSAQLGNVAVETPFGFGTGTGRCANADCSQVQSAQAVLATGSVAPAPVPLPAGGALMLAGLAGLALVRRRKP